jgi:hypothetical protein
MPETMTPYPAPWCDTCIAHEGHFHCVGLPHCTDLHDRQTETQAAQAYVVVMSQIEPHSLLRDIACGLCLTLPPLAVIVALLCLLLRR